MSALHPYLRAGDGVIDVGANDGHYATGYAKVVGPTGCVVAVEPDPKTADLCRARCTPWPMVRVVQAAVSCCAGMATLYRDSDHRRHSLWEANTITKTGDAVSVPMVTLDSLAVDVPHLTAIKIDAQGAEAQILAGATETLTNPALTWAVELWAQGLTDAGSSVDAVIDVFEAHGWHPVGSTWDQVRPKARIKNGHGAIDVLLQHAERSH